MTRGKGTRGRGGRGASASKVGTRANPIAMQDLGAHEETVPQLTPSSSSGGAGAGEDGAGGGGKHGAKRKQKDESDEEEDWGLEGKSFWKSKIPQSVDTAEYVHEQLAPQFKKDIWAGKYCDLTLFLSRVNEMRSGETWSLVDRGFNRKIVRPKITTLIEWVKCFTKYMQTMAV